MALWQDRARLRTALRNFFDTQGYLEIDTPVAVSCPGVEVHLQFFETHWHGAQNETRKLWLRTSPEIHLKKALTSGPGKIYEIAKCFRNRGEHSDWHHPEFTMVEWYQVGGSLSDLMDQTEGLLRHCYRAFGKAAEHSIKRLTVGDVFKTVTGVELDENDKGFATKLRSAGCQSVSDDDDFETAYHKAMLDKVEAFLQSLGIVFLYNYPRCTSALAAVSGSTAQRFECYINGVEICNGFQELLGKDANAARFADINARRLEIYGDQIETDRDFLLAMEQLKDPVIGNALGFDRLLACIRGDESISRVIPFRW